MHVSPTVCIALPPPAGLKDGETGPEAATREAFEEAGVSCDPEHAVRLGQWTDEARKCHTEYFAALPSAQETSPEGRDVKWVPLSSAGQVLLEKNGMAAAVATITRDKLPGVIRR